jgi:Protein of unknown function (DUF3540)
MNLVRSLEAVPDLRSTPATGGLPLAASVSDYLGPAEVLEVETDAVRVRLPGGAVVPAELAMALAYEPVVGDRLLVIGRGADHYVIGVLHGNGRTALTVQGDVDLRAANGRLRLSGDLGVEILGPELEVRTGKLEVVADAAVQRFTSLYQRVTKLFSIRAAQAHTVIDGAQVTQAREATIQTEGTMTINGQEINLG